MKLQLLKKSRRLIGMFLSFVMVISLFAGIPFGQALATDSQGAPIDIDTATSVALIFVADMIHSDPDPSVTWTDSTQISNTQTMYDAGGNVAAYTFELANGEVQCGYVVVSAYENQNLIQEYAYTRTPIYNSMNAIVSDKVIYTGALGYYIEDASGQVTDENMHKVDKSNIKQQNIGNGQIKNGNAAILNDIKQKGAIKNKDVSGKINMNPNANPNSYSSNGNHYGDKNGNNGNHNGLYNGSGSKLDILPTYSGPGTDGYGTIKDPVPYANNTYGGTFTCNGNYVNSYEPYCSYFTTGLASQNSLTSKYTGGTCGPVAVTNLIRLYGNKDNKSSVKNATDYSIMDTVVKAGVASGYCSSVGGANNNPGLVVVGFKAYGYTTVSSSQVAYSFSQAQTELQNCTPFLLYLSQNGGSPYTSTGTAHDVACYAYTQFVQSGTNAIKSFLKVEDGWSSDGGRYIDASLSYASICLIRPYNP